MSERIVRAFADIVDAPGGLLLVSDGGRAISVAGNERMARQRPAGGPVRRRERVLDLGRGQRPRDRIGGVRGGWASAADKPARVPQWLLDDQRAWAGIPLLHHRRLIGLVVLAAPEYPTPARLGGFRPAAHGRAPGGELACRGARPGSIQQAQRFEEFNRRFAFILHDIKNLVSQLSLLARNAERHADNPEFRADMVATLKSSVGKMNELLARLAPQSSGRVQRIEGAAAAPDPHRGHRRQARDREVSLLGDAGVEALVDAQALEQAVGHLLQNALDASSGEPVTVRVSPEGDDVAIAIADKGVGMDGDFIRNRLFQPFASTKPGGFGIGAFEARSLITAMGGRISVDSRLGPRHHLHHPSAGRRGGQPNRRKRA